MNSLATIASTAPWVGLLGTLLGIYNSYPGGSWEKRTLLAIINARLSESLVPTALGISVALVAMWCYKYLLSEVEVFDQQMESTSLELINDLSRLGTRLT